MKYMIGLLCAVLFFSCKTKKEIQEATPVIKENKTETLITMRKGACFGRCPVYIITLNQDGYSTFDGKKFADRKGLFEKTFSKEETNRVLSAFKEANLSQYQDFYESDIPDMPTVTINYMVDSTEKEIKGKSERPEAVFKLQMMMEQLAETDDWTIKEVEEEETEEVDKTIIYKEIIIEPNKGMVLSQWLKKKKEEYGVRLLKKVSPSLNYWLITYDSKIMEPEAMLDALLNDPKIKHAEFNKKVQMRDGSGETPRR